MELHFADHAKLEKKGRTFDCKKCPAATQKLRRCWEDRWDFTPEKDGNVFPVRISEGGGLFGFCPAKATRDQEAIGLFELMVVACQQQVLLVAGGLAEQPGWFVQLLSWFGPSYDTMRFMSRAKMILGDDDKGSRTPAPQKKPTGKRRG